MPEVAGVQVKVTLSSVTTEALDNVADGALGAAAATGRYKDVGHDHL